ncbi:hypothetical protein CERSUDRAFT_100580 [Gelatoporia subvermispora B]|uniref:Uncharacterized protein n=1 Tax=Ceriporiopsis subvermispora (strain B) TaxID=914234 RepID=M2QZ71_CERS8|nr:hypothetical protein CERSUDRAFT_100580 [Gelatoporia subvermispora B]
MFGLTCEGRAAAETTNRGKKDARYNAIVVCETAFEFDEGDFDTVVEAYREEKTNIDTVVTEFPPRRIQTMFHEAQHTMLLTGLGSGLEDFKYEPDQCAYALGPIQQCNNAQNWAVLGSISQIDEVIFRRPALKIQWLEHVGGPTLSLAD